MTSRAQSSLNNFLSLIPETRQPSTVSSSNQTILPDGSAIASSRTAFQTDLITDTTAKNMRSDSNNSTLSSSSSATVGSEKSVNSGYVGGPGTIDGFLKVGH